MRYDKNHSDEVRYVNLNDQNSNRKISRKCIIVTVVTLITLTLFSVCLWRLLLRRRTHTTTEPTTKIKCRTCLNFTLTTMSHENNDITALPPQLSDLTMMSTFTVSSHISTVQTTVISTAETTFTTMITTNTMNTMSTVENYINKVIYIQSVDVPDRYLSKKGTDWRIYLLPFSSDTTAFVLRQCVWQLLQKTYPNLPCISLEAASTEPRKYLQHGNHRVFLASSDPQGSPNFIGDASFLLVGNTTNFYLRSTVAMEIRTIIWLNYHLPNYEVYMRWEHEIKNLHRFRFVLQ